MTSQAQSISGPFSGPDNLNYVIYESVDVVPISEVLPDMSNQISALGYDYFSLVKTTKRSYKVGTFSWMREDRWIITVYDKKPNYSHWEIQYDYVPIDKVEYFDFSDIE